MRFMHDRNAVHGHLKPTNLLLDEKWRVRIGDFGTSKFGGSGGYAHYLSPERFHNRPQSREGDVYSFGLILYEVVTGKPALAFELRPHVVMKRIIDGVDLAMPDWVYPPVAGLIRRCCSSDCDERPPFEEIFDILKAMQFRILPGVRPKKVERFTEQIEAWEKKRVAFLEGEGDGQGGDPREYTIHIIIAIRNRVKHRICIERRAKC
jgi:serine/threonine protein kinase